MAKGLDSEPLPADGLAATVADSSRGVTTEMPTDIRGVGAFSTWSVRLFKFIY